MYSTYILKYIDKDNPIYDIYNIKGIQAESKKMCRCNSGQERF